MTALEEVLMNDGSGWGYGKGVVPTISLDHSNGVKRLEELGIKDDIGNTIPMYNHMKKGPFLVFDGESRILSVDCIENFRRVLIKRYGIESPEKMKEVVDCFEKYF